MDDAALLDSLGIKLAPGKRFLTLRERRSLGITWFGIVRVVRDLKAEDPAVLMLPKRQRAEMVFGRLVDENPEAFGRIDWENIDWEALMRFIEFVVEIVLRIIAIWI